MKLEYKFTIMSLIALGLLSGFMYIYWWGFLYAEGESYLVNMNNYGEFLGEFIGVHIVLIIILILFFTSVKKVVRHGFKDWKKKKKRRR